MGSGDGPKLAYSLLIAKLAIGAPVSGEEITLSVPDPELFRDAWDLATHGVWTPEGLEGADALLVALVRKIRNTKVHKSKS